MKNVDFTTNPKAALNIALGQSKGTIARMEGDWVNHNPRSIYNKALDLLDNDEWVQVGMNPFKHSYFYDKKTTFKMPIFVLIFIAVLFLNTYLDISNMTALFIDQTSNIFLFTGLFCIGTSIDKQSMLTLNKGIVLHALILWVIAILLSYILVSYVL